MPAIDDKTPEPAGTTSSVMQVLAVKLYKSLALHLKSTGRVKIDNGQTTIWIDEKLTLSLLRVDHPAVPGSMVRFTGQFLYFQLPSMEGIID